MNAAFCFSRPPFLEYSFYTPICLSTDTDGCPECVPHLSSYVVVYKKVLSSFLLFFCTTNTKTLSVSPKLAYSIIQMKFYMDDSPCKEKNLIEI